MKKILLPLLLMALLMPLTANAQTEPTVLFSEDFESLTTTGQIPTGWNNADGTTTNSNYKWCYQYTQGQYGNTHNTGHNKTKCIRFDSNNNDNGLTNYLKTPVISLPSETEMALSFWYKNNKGGDFTVYISTDGGATYLDKPLLTRLTNTPNKWTQHETVSLADYAGQNVVIVFGGTSNYGNAYSYIYLDDVSVSELVCEAETIDTWTENFDHYITTTDFTTNNLPVCWQYHNYTGNQSYTGYPLIYGYSAHSSPNCLMFYYTFDYGNVDPQMAFLPPINNLDDKRIHFFAKTTTNTSIKIGRMDENLYTFHEIATFELTSTYQEYYCDLTRPYVTITGDYIAIRMEQPFSNQTNIVFIDDITIKDACKTPTNLSFVAKNHSVELDWTENGSANKWDIAYKVQTASEWTSVDGITQKPYTLTGLLPGTQYQVKVRANCGNGLGDQSDWSKILGFNTLEAYPVPSDLVCDAFTATTATLSWTDNSDDCTGWQICLNGDEEHLIAANSNPFTLENLTPDVAYWAKVRACFNGNHQSEWSSALYFEPTNKTIIGSGTDESGILPTPTSYAYSALTQQIYTADELGDAGYIESIAFYTEADEISDVDIYMVHTDKNEFSNTDDWITVTPADMVYSGYVFMDSGVWNTIRFDKGFLYDGNHNVAIIVYMKKSTTGGPYLVFDASSQAIACISYDVDDFDPTSPPIGADYTDIYDYKNQLRVGKVTEPSCIMPAFLNASYITATSAMIDWTSDNDNFDIRYKTYEESEWTIVTDVKKPYVFPYNLTKETTYCVEARSNCGVDGISDWSNVCYFETLPTCYQPTDLTVVKTTNTSATLFWIENGGAEEWHICINDDEEHYIPVDNYIYTITGLTAETEYTVKVRSSCGTDDYSQWSEPVTFVATSQRSFTYHQSASSSGNDVMPLYYRNILYHRAKSQFIIPKNEFPYDCLGSTINKLTFYSTTEEHSLYNAQFKVYLAEVENSTFSTAEYINWETLDKVYEGTLSISDNKMVIELSTPYIYCGGNLLVGFYQTVGSSNQVFQIFWKYATVENSGVYEDFDNITQKTSYSPKVTFNYTVTSTPRPDFIDVIDYSEGILVHWLNEIVSEGLTGYEYQYKLATSDEWSAATTVNANTTHAIFTGLTEGATYDFRIRARYGIKFSIYTSTQFEFNTEENVKIFPEAGNWESANFLPPGNPTDEDYVIILADVTIGNGTNAQAYYIGCNYGVVTIENGGTLYVNEDAYGLSIVVNEGGQLITTDGYLYAIVNKTTAASETKTSNSWYAIASPIYDLDIEYAVKGIHNVYSYVEKSNYWNEYRNLTVDEELGLAPFTTFETGRGYLYRSTKANIKYGGMVNSSDVTYPLTADCGIEKYKGLNLIGNPFTHNIYKNDVYQPTGDAPAINSDKLAAGYYRLEPDGTWTSTIGYGNPIKPGEGVLVKATEGFDLTIENSINPAAEYTPSAKSGCNSVMFAVANEQFKDVAYAMFSDGVGLNKIEHYNPEIQMLYINRGDDNYAIAMMDKGTQSFNLNFKAMTTGKYTLSCKAAGNFDYLHVIDRLTGEDADMLLEGEYSFIASPRDDDNRFIVKLGYSSGDVADDGIFAYQSGDDIIVTGEGELQVFDVTGRMVMTQHVNGVQTCHGASLQCGVYIFKLNGKTQKIVVK